MKSNEQTENNKQNRDRFIDGEQMTALGGRAVEGGGIEEKELMDVDNSVIIVGGRQVKGTKCQWEYINK